MINFALSFSSNSSTLLDSISVGVERVGVGALEVEEEPVASIPIEGKGRMERFEGPGKSS